MNLVLRHRDTSAATTCVVCRDPAGVLAVCRGCGTTTHAECAAESRGCPTLGCASRDPLPVARWSEQNVDLRDARPPARAGWGAQNVRSDTWRRSGSAPTPRRSLARLLTEPLSDSTIAVLFVLVVGAASSAILLTWWVNQ